METLNQFLNRKDFVKYLKNKDFDRNIDKIILLLILIFKESIAREIKENYERKRI